MQLGIVGLPFSGKSTLFQAVTKTHLDPAAPATTGAHAHHPGAARRVVPAVLPGALRREPASSGIQASAAVERCGIVPGIAPMQDLSSSRFWVLWGVAFLGFPAAGLAARLVGAVTTPTRALVAGAISGATLGLVQWLVLRLRLPLLPFWWVIATGIGMSIGLAVGATLLGDETFGNELLGRAAITGVCIGVAQGLVLQSFVPQASLWVGAVAAGWPLGWFITRGIGVDLSFKWSVFGSVGAWAFQLLTGLTLYVLLRSPSGMK